MATELGMANLLLPLGGFVANIVFARTLGASGRGELAAIVAAMSVFEAVLTFGLPDILARHIARGSLPLGAQRTLAAGAVAASLIPGVVLGVYCHSRSFSWPVAVVAGLAVPVMTAVALGRGILVGRRAYRRLTGAFVLTGALRLVAPLVLILVDRPTEDLALILVIGWTVAPAVPIFLSRPFAGPVSSVGDGWKILRESLGYWPATLAWQVNARLDQLVLAMFVSSADLGRYAVCVGIAEVPSALASGPRQVLLARVAKTHISKNVMMIPHAFLLAGVMAGVLAAYFSAPLLGAVFGPEFRSAAPVLGILLVATGFDIAAGLLNSCLTAVGRGRSAAMNQLVGLTITAIALPIAVLQGGIILAAAVRSAASASAYLLALVSVRSFNRSEVAPP